MKKKICGNRIKWKYLFKFGFYFRNYKCLINIVEPLTAVKYFHSKQIICRNYSCLLFLVSIGFFFFSLHWANENCNLWKVGRLIGLHGLPYFCCSINTFRRCVDMHKIIRWMTQRNNLFFPLCCTFMQITILLVIYHYLLKILHRNVIQKTSKKD